MYLNILTIHAIFASIFALYIIIDRAYIRNFVQKEKRERFYSKSKFVLIFISLITVFSGIYLVYKLEFDFIILLKIILASLLLYGFFNCPFYMKRQECKTRQFMYRFGVLILLFFTIFVGIYI